uniref:Uncharacterized protein n=1 Tax=Mycena chlorophos TaxID=658473 RepID=A0ABQ0LDA3_MYCCL|nr:predicted protein [Mycena chlorophos]
MGLKQIALPLHSGRVAPDVYREEFLSTDAMGQIFAVADREEDSEERPSEGRTKSRSPGTEVTEAISAEVIRRRLVLHHPKPPHSNEDA